MTNGDQESVSLVQVQDALRTQGDPWQAGETSISQLPPEERALRLGYTPGPGEQSLQEREQAAAAQVHTYGAVAAAGYPAAFDLRNVSGQNYITAIKDQGGCGSCVAFGSSATVEGTARFQRGNAGLAIDLSEAQLFYCIARSQGRTCGGATGGWWPEAALDAFKNTGIADEACYPYTAGDQNCTHLCSDWQSRVTKISGWHKITSTDDMKTWISTKGPLSTCFTVYTDFFSYKSGVYKYVTGKVEGGHCVSAVGYDNVAGCWICKNSWSAGWGDGGFFRIGYGQCGLDSAMWAVESVIETGWQNNRSVQGLWTIDQDRNAWAYLSGLGWRRIAGDNDNIFFNLLTQLSAAKAAHRPVNAYLQAGVITQVYVL